MLGWEYNLEIKYIFKIYDIQLIFSIDKINKVYREVKLWQMGYFMYRDVQEMIKEGRCGLFEILIDFFIYDKGNEMIFIQKNF